MRREMTVVGVEALRGLNGHGIQVKADTFVGDELTFITMGTDEEQFHVYDTIIVTVEVSK